jgi:hypothetical protein
MITRNVLTLRAITLTLSVKSIHDQSNIRHPCLSILPNRPSVPSQPSSGFLQLQNLALDVDLNPQSSICQIAARTALRQPT